jgi:hypothetical protein
LQTQITALSAQVADASCNGLQTSLGTFVNTINAVNEKYKTTLAEAQLLPASQDPGATMATVKEDFANLATAALGSNSNTPNGGPLDSAINGIHDLLMGQGGDASAGVIHVCAQAGLLNYRTVTKKGTQTAQQWVDDRPYYAYVTALVNYYENYEVLGTTLIQEAAYYRVTALLARDKVTVPADQTTSACAVPDRTSDDPGQMCRNSAALTRHVYGNLVAEWTLTGRPYSDGKVVLQVDDAATGNGAGAQPILWVRDPTSVIASMATGTWQTDPNKTGSYDAFDGWKPARLDEWQSLQKGAAQALSSCNSGSVVSLSVFTCMAQYSGLFTHYSGTFWMPGQQATGLKLPAPDFSVLSVLGYGGNRYQFEYGGPDLALRCFATGEPSGYTPFACSQDWLDHHVAITKATAESEHTLEATYTVQWGFQVPGVSLPPWSLGYYYLEPINQTGDYAFDATNQAYPLRINDTPDPTPALPFFLQSFQMHALKVCDGSAGTHYMCAAADFPYAPKETTEKLWQTLTVVTTNTDTQQCVNTVGVPQLCAPRGNAKPTAQDQPFENFLNETIPNPSQPSPAPTGHPSIKLDGGTAECAPAGWKAPPDNWAYGKVSPLPDTWTATSGGAAYTTPTSPNALVRLDDKLDLHRLVKTAGFDATQPFQLTCTVNARWDHLVNTGSAISAVYQVTPVGSGFVVTRVPDAPVIGTASAGPESATVKWTVGASGSDKITNFQITPYIGGVAQPALKPLPATGGDLSPTAGAKDSVTIAGLKSGTTYTFSVRANAAVPGSTAVVSSPLSAESLPVTPKEVKPLTPITPTTTTTTVPLTPLSTTTTTVPLTPVTPTTVPLAPVSPAYAASVTRVDAHTALASFVPHTPVKLVDLHYDVHGQQQDFRMVLQANGGYETPVVNLSAGDDVSYWFYYEPSAPGSAPVITPRGSYTQK